MLRFTHVLALVCLCGLFLCVSNANATTYVFGQDGNDQNLTGSGAGKTWTSSDAFIIAGDVYVSDNDTLNIQSGVSVQFDGSLSLPTAIPEIEVKGTIICQGTAVSNVTFTNYSRTTKGLFKGIYCDGDSLSPTSDYEGRLEATYTKFLYGGYGTGIIRAGERSYLDLENCDVKYSDEAGIYCQDTGSKVDLDNCTIRDNDTDGLGTSDDANDYMHLNILSCSFIDNGDAGVDNGMPGRDPGDPDPEIVRNSYYRGQMPAIHHEAYQTLIVENTYFFHNNRGIQIENNQHCNECFHLIANNIFAHQEVAIFISDLDREIEEEEETIISNIHIINNVIWNSTIFGINIWGWQCPDGGDWPDGLITLERNIFGPQINDPLQADKYIRFLVAPVDEAVQISAMNAFPDDDAENFTNSDPSNALIEDDGGATWELADEVGDDETPGSYDFHIQWTNGSRLIDADNTADDFDGSDADIGAYGWNQTADEGIGRPIAGERPGGINWRGFFNDDPWNDYPLSCAFYIHLDDDAFGAATVLPANHIYHFDEDVDIDVGESVTVTAPATFCANGAFKFDVYGEFIAVGSAGNEILFADGTSFNTTGYDGDGWGGINIRPGADTDTEFEYCEIVGVDDNGAAAIRFNNVGGSGWLWVVDCNIHENAADAVYINNNSWVTLEGTEIYNCGGDGIFVLDLTTSLKVCISETFIHDNTGNGIILNNSDIAFDNDAIPTQIHENTLYGFDLEDSSPDLENTSVENELWHNAAGEIFINNSVPEIEYNDIEPTNDEVFAIEWLLNDLSAIDGEYVWWGTDDPDAVEDDLFSNPNLIDYDPHVNSEYIANAEDYNLARSFYFDCNFNSAIARFENCIEDDDSQARRCTAIRFLLGAYQQAGYDLDDLRTYLNGVARRLEDDFVANYACEYSIWSLIYDEDYEGMLAAYVDRRGNFDNQIFSLRNEIQVLKVQMLMAEAEIGNQNDSYSANDYLSKIQELKDQIAELNAMGTDEAMLPQTIALHEPYPNPFNSRMTVGYDLNKQMEMKLAIFDVLGKQVAIIENGVQPAGRYNLTWDAKDVTSGVYFVKLQTPDRNFTRKVTLVK